VVVVEGESMVRGEGADLVSILIEGCEMGGFSSCGGFLQPVRLKMSAGMVVLIV
jgi:hypothetical protein